MPDEIICADITLTFEFPKLSFLFPESEKYIGKFDILPIGLHLTYIENTQTKNYFLTSSFIKPLLKKRKLFSHKGNFGHALLISGSKGKMGASVLASQACLRSGAGLITTHIPAIGYNVIQTAFPECMASIDNKEEYITNLPDLFPYSAVAAGPGIGKDIQTQNVVKLLIQNAICPILLDADALNILGENKTWLGFLPPESILTPHPKEFDNIAGSSGNSFERWQLQSKVSIKYNVFIVLKGHYTSITCPDGNCYFNSTGNPGMATAGSGDVLTGIILGLLAQGYSSKNACIIGVYLHGLAGDIAAEHTGYEALIASDIINKLGMALGKLRK
jgi:NAD(P)H-hydrate epimerase